MCDHVSNEFVITPMNILGPALLFTYFKRRSNTNETVHFNSDCTTKFIEKMSFFNKFDKRKVLS